MGGATPPRADSATLDGSRARAKPGPRPDTHHPCAFAARVRSELHHLAGAPAEGDYDEAARCLCPDPADAWDPRRIDEALAPYYADYPEIVFTPLARRPDRTLLKELGSRQWRATQVLLDPEGDDLWCVECEIDLPPGKVSDEPLIRLRRIGT